jgi:hypothetical protein
MRARELFECTAAARPDGQRESHAMNVWGVLSVMWRRWYVFVPLLVAAVALALVVPKASAPSYSVQSVIMLQAPTAVSQTVPGTTPGSTQTITKNLNPLLGNSVGLTPDSQLEGTVIMSRAKAKELHDSGFDGSYVVTPSDKQATMTVVTTDKSAAAAQKANKKVVDMITKDIDARQGVAVNDPTQRVTVVPLTDPELTQVAGVSKYRAAAAIGLAGLLLALTISVLVDAAASSRRRRRVPRAHSVGTAVGIQ